MAEGRFLSNKQIKINKDNTIILVVVAVCSFIFVFSLFASKSLLSKRSYQSRVNTALQSSLNQIQGDQASVNKLSATYQTFINKSPNVIGGNLTGPGTNVGNNEKIIKDSLPATYDFPATLASMQSLFSINGITVNSVSGTDSSSSKTSSAGSGSSTISPSSSSVPTPIPFSISVTGSYANINILLTDIEESIRPIEVQSISMSGDNSALTVNMSIVTYYLPPISLNVGSETVQ